MKILPLAILLLSSIFAAAQVGVTLVATSGEEGTVHYSEPLVLAAGDTAQVVTAITQDSTYSAYTGPRSISLTIGGKELRLSLSPSGDTPYIQPGITIAGPATIKAVIETTTAGKIALLTAKVTRAGGEASVTPAGAVVIPEDANGQFQVILESSTDMVSWTAANPGTYGGTTDKRFFRTRIVKQ